MDTVEQLIELTNSYYQRGWTPATSSNFSIRESQNTLRITRSGRHKGTLQLAGFMKMTTAGASIDEGTPSAETALHLMLYQAQQETTAVLHTHSPKATAFSMLQQDESLKFAGYEILKAFPGIETHETEVELKIFENSQNIPALVALIEPSLEKIQLPAFLIRGHGIYAWGNSLAEADRHLEAIEYLIECETLRRQLTL